MKTKICELHDGRVSLLAMHTMLALAKRHNMGAYVRIYALDALGNPDPTVMHHRDSKTGQPVTQFPEWGIEFENGVVCSAVGTPTNPDGPMVTVTTRAIGKSVVNPGRFRDTEMVCPICHRQFREHAFQEFGDCWKKIYGETSLSDARWPPSWPPSPPQK